MANPRIVLYATTSPSRVTQYHAKLLNEHGAEIHQNLIMPQEDIALAWDTVRTLRQTFMNTKHTYGPQGEIVGTFPDPSDPEFHSNHIEEDDK